MAIKNHANAAILCSTLKASDQRSDRSDCDERGERFDSIFYQCPVKVLLPVLHLAAGNSGIALSVCQTQQPSPFA